MFITNRNAGWTRRGDQFASGRFLILMQPDTSDGHKSPLRGIVRFTSLHQFGHFMMGRARIGAHRITLSGSYGNDGLPCSVPQAVYDRGTIVPTELVEAWNTGGGWNGVGTEAEVMRQWAKDNFLTP
jgi:hypothetical protein